MLFRKIIKGFDNQNYKLVLTKHRIKQLENHIESVIPKKKRKVQTNPNSRFAGIRIIKQA